MNRISVGLQITSYDILFEPICAITFAVSNKCGGKLSGQGGVVVSPGYPDNYPNNSVCVWTITGREGDRIRLTFTDFALEDSLNCQLDSLEVTSNFLYQTLTQPHDHV